jgi:hypothetical protein
MPQRGEWRVILWSAVLWAALGPPLVVILSGAGALLSGYIRMTARTAAVLVMWPIFAPGAAVAGALTGFLLLSASRRAPSLLALRVRGATWGAGLGLLGFVFGFVVVVMLTEGEGPAQSWGDPGWALRTVPGVRPEVVGVYAAIALSGAILGWIVAEWTASG